MNEDYKDSRTEYYHFLLWLIYSILIGWSFYNFGYGEARAEYSQLSKYRCIDGTVYRSMQGYWEKSGQTCIILDQKN